MGITAFEWPGFVLASMVAIIIASALNRRFLPRRFQGPGMGAILLRILGSLLRVFVLFTFYKGIGDSWGYFTAGLRYGPSIWHLDFWFLRPDSGWWAHRWWGTQMVRFISGIVVAMVGPTMRGEFVIFALMSYVGLVLIYRAFLNAYEGRDSVRYFRWLFLWPSLWFWPCSAGKDAVCLLAIGLVVYGFAGDKTKIRFAPVLAGLGLSGVVRPHVAVLLILTAGTVHFFSAKKRKGRGFAIQAVLIAVISVVVVQHAVKGLGIEETDMEGVEDAISARAHHTSTGGSAVDTAPSGILGVFVGYANVLLRPFPWEAHSVSTLMAAGEMGIYWFMVFRRRKDVWRTVKSWRSERLLCFSFVFTAAYSLILGLAISNLGIVARQRTAVFPFMFLILSLTPQKVEGQAEPVPESLPRPRLSPLVIRT